MRDLTRGGRLSILWLLGGCWCTMMEGQCPRCGTWREWGPMNLRTSGPWHIRRREIEDAALQHRHLHFFNDSRRALLFLGTSWTFQLQAEVPVGADVDVKRQEMWAVHLVQRVALRHLPYAYDVGFDIKRKSFEEIIFCKLCYQILPKLFKR